MLVKRGGGHHVGIRGRRGARDPEHGAAAVEMALVLPILLIVVFGIIEFGFAFNAQISLTQAVREGVRVGAIGEAPSEADMVTRMGVAYTGVRGTPVEDTTQPLSSRSCDPESPSGDAILRGRVDYEPLIGWFGDGTIALRARAVMRCGG
jgi:hypothetical protein